MFTIKDGVLIKYCGKGGCVQVPEGVIEIADGVFAESLDLTFNIGVNHFEPRNAENAEINEVILPRSLKKIGNSAFYGCQKLTKINIPVNVETIGIEAFAGCVSLREIYFDAKRCEADYIHSYSSLRPINAFASSGQNENGIKLTVGKNVEQFPDSVFVMTQFSHSLNYKVPVHLYLYPEGFPKITELCFEDGLNPDVVCQICASLDCYFCPNFLQVVQISSDNRFDIFDVIKNLLLANKQEKQLFSLPLPPLKGAWSGRTVTLQYNYLSELSCKYRI